jgi:transcriptional regulator with XRE-family HTH domain
MNKFGKYLTRKLKERGMTQSQLSYYSGISDAHISRLSKEERGLPKIDTLQKIAAALKMSLMEMLKELGFFEKPVEELPENLQAYLRSNMPPGDITQEEIDALATHSYYEGSEASPQGYSKLLKEIRSRPENRILRLMANQKQELRENCAKMIEAYISVFGEK